MNRRQRIIVSITGIFLVLLFLIALTYGYYITKIEGNINSKSILAKTVNLSLKYDDDDGSIIGDEETVIPGTTFDAKTFTVTNTGKATTDYVVVIENVKVTDLATGETTTFKSNDFTYTLSCTNGCNEVKEQTPLPMSEGILVGNRIEVGETQTYSFALTYEETGVDQSADMNKSLEARINIKDISSINPYKNNPSSLAYNIINNAIVGKTGTTLLNAPLAEVAKTISKYGTGEYELRTDIELSGLTYGDTMDEADMGLAGEVDGGTKLEQCNSVKGKYISDAYNWYYDGLPIGYVSNCDSEGNPYIEIMKDEKTLSVTQDDYGTSYYYRGAVEDNYVEFNNMCWRIVRVEGDGSIKITLAAQKKCSEITSSDTDTAFIGTGHYGYNQTKVTNSSGQQSTGDKYVADYVNSPINNTTSMKYKLDEWLVSSGIDTSKLKKDAWCLGNTKDAYEPSTQALLSDGINDLMYKSKTFNYDTTRRLYGYGTNIKYATLRCNGNNFESYESYIGTLIVDEVVFAGGKVFITNETYYLNDNAVPNGWWTLSPSRFSGNNDNAFFINNSDETYDDDFVNDGRVNEDDVDSNYNIRPAVTLSSSTLITKGDGSKYNPYIVE